jgi:hypothetical protein
MTPTITGLAACFATMIAPMLLSGTGGDLAKAYAAVQEALMGAAHIDEVMPTAQSLILTIGAIDNMNQSMPESVSLPLKLRLRANANALSRSARVLTNDREAMRAQRLRREQATTIDALHAATEAQYAARAAAPPSQPAAAPAAPPQPTKPQTTPAASQPRQTPQQPAPQHPTRFGPTPQEWAAAMLEEAADTEECAKTLSPAARSLALGKVAALRQAAAELQAGKVFNKADLLGATAMPAAVPARSSRPAP